MSEQFLNRWVHISLIILDSFSFQFWESLDKLYCPYFYCFFYKVPQKAGIQTPVLAPELAQIKPTGWTVKDTIQFI